MQDEFTSDGSIIRHHYQRQTVWPGAGRQRSVCNGMIWITRCKPTLHPSHFYACQSNTVMTASMTSFPNKTQISLWWLRSLTLLHTSHPLMWFIERGKGGVRAFLGALILKFIVICLRHCPCSVFPTRTVSEQNGNQSFPLRRCDLLLAFICVSAQRFKLLHAMFIPGSQRSDSSPVICCR